MTAHPISETTLGGIKAQLTEVLQAVCLTPEQITAERDWFLEAVFGIDKTQQYHFAPDTKCDAQTCAALNALLEQRIRLRQPIQYLIGQTPFYGLPFRVTPDVLIPRPETEYLVSGVSHWLGQHKKTSEDTHILDLGTGSGAIAIALKHLHPSANIHAVDISDAALAVARHNAEVNTAAITFWLGSWTAPLVQHIPQQRFDVIVSNPPYIDLADKPTLQPEVLNEPHLALFAPHEPVQFYEALIAECLPWLKPNGLLGFELGIGTGEPLLARLQQKAPTSITWTLEADLAGIPRILWGQTKP